MKTNQLRKETKERPHTTRIETTQRYGNRRRRSKEEMREWIVEVGLVSKFQRRSPRRAAPLA